MKNKSLFLILFAVLVILTLSVSSSLAQDVDISNMDNAQLMALLQQNMLLMQQIMEKLEDSGSGMQDPDQFSTGSGQQAEESDNQLTAGSGRWDSGCRGEDLQYLRE